MGFLRNQFRKVIQWANVESDLIVYKYPLEKKVEIMKHSKLVVREGQRAVFINQGKLADVFEPGTYDLDDVKNIPILTAIYSWTYAFESPFTADIYFIQSKQFIDNKWSTSKPIMMRDKDFGMVRVEAEGKFSFKVKSPSKAMFEVFGSSDELRVRDVVTYLKSMMTSLLANAIGESKLAALDLAANYDLLAQAAKAKLADDMEALGLEISGLYVENIVLPEEVNAMMDKRTSVGVMKGSIDDYAKIESVGAMRDAAKNPGGFAGTGVGLGAGVALGKMFAETLNLKEEVKQEVNEDLVKCPSCNAQVSKNAKFCSECGNKLEKKSKFCPNCGTEIKGDSKFCAECGHKL